MAYLASMVAIMRTTREQWIEQGLAALASGGPDSVRVEALAAALGVSKGGFYGQFADRAALLDEMLDTWERESTSDVRQRVEAQGGDARRKLRQAGALTFSTDRLLPIDLAVREWARRDPDVADRLQGVDEQRMSYLRELFTAILGDQPEEVEARSLLAFSLAIGHHFLAAGHDGRSRTDVLRRASRILESPPAG